jgi:hypothetical protein
MGLLSNPTVHHQVEKNHLLQLHVCSKLQALPKQPYRSLPPATSLPCCTLEELHGAGTQTENSPKRCVVEMTSRIQGLNYVWSSLVITVSACAHALQGNISNLFLQIWDWWKSLGKW